MLIRVVARGLETTEDLILQGIEPSDTYIWKVKYILVEDIEEFEELEKKKSVLYFYNDRPPLIIKEHPDDFYARYKEAIKEFKKKDDDIELEETQEEDDGAEDSDGNESS